MTEMFRWLLNKSNEKIFSGVVNCLLDVKPIYLQQLVRMNYKFDLKVVFDRLSIPYSSPKPEVPTTQPELFPPSVQQIILDQAAKTGFYIDQEDAKRLLEKIDSSWFGDHSFISFIAIKIREHEKYKTKPVEEQRRIFRKVLLDADNYRQEYPVWREKQEKKEREESLRTERREILSELKRNPPSICQCGAKLDDEQRCPECKGEYRINEEDLVWAFYSSSEISLTEGFWKRQKERVSEAAN
jgi:hypothetical protein